MTPLGQPNAEDLARLRDEGVVDVTLRSELAHNIYSRL